MAETERLTTQLDAGTLEQLRTLAGGPRKIGAFLSTLTQWLWSQRAALEAAPLTDYHLCARLNELTINEVFTRIDALEYKYSDLDQLLVDAEQLIDELKAQLKEKNKMSE